MKIKSSAVMLCTVLTVTACEKKSITLTTGDSAAALATRGVADVAVPALRDQWKAQSGFIASAAEMMPEANYAFKPAKVVRSFGEIIGHVAGSQKLFCAIALGEPQPAEDAVEKGTHTKAELVAAIKESNTYCARAYDISGTAAADTATMFGSPSTKFGALTLNATHDAEHYGNIVTYMRIKGLVPPSSQPSSPPPTVVPPKDSAKK